ncbi:MAG: 2-oxo acid dehydrogenase subunit E2 [Bacteroidetes bacterium]|nr:2-oxo acid dehydrogenase subunit E2 [Bacteroidota bacterium]
MDLQYKYRKIPRSRIATFDIFSIGLMKHHAVGLLEFDVTDSRAKIRDLKRNGAKISFNAWIIKVIGKALAQHPEAAAFLCSKRKLITFDDINISILIEKEINGKKVPIPMIIEKTNEKNVQEITGDIKAVKRQVLTEQDVVLQKRPKLHERIYYHLPGIIRRMVWRFMLDHPKIAYKKMGNAGITSLSAVAQMNGWFIHKSIHPVSFGIGSIIKKPAVINDEIKIREILNMTILIDHDVIDGGPIVRFVKDLTRYIETGEELQLNKQ